MLRRSSALACLGERFKVSGVGGRLQDRSDIVCGPGCVPQGTNCEVALLTEWGGLQNVD
jgi:hypothetical protein